MAIDGSLIVYSVKTVLIILTWNFEYENGCVEGNS